MLNLGNYKNVKIVNFDTIFNKEKLQSNIKLIDTIKFQNPYFEIRVFQNTENNDYITCDNFPSY